MIIVITQLHPIKTLRTAKNVEVEAILRSKIDVICKH